MKRFKNILLVCDNDSVHSQLVDRAVWLADKNGSRVTLVDVLDAAPGELSRKFSALPGRRGANIEHELKDFHRERLGSLAAKFRAGGVPTEQVVLQGIPFIEIIKRVLTNGHDLVMKGVAQTPASGARFFASADMHLLRKCPCPLWLMKKTGSRQYDRVLAAVDPDPEGMQHEALNPLIMDLATSLSAADDSELHVVSAWSFAAESALRHSQFAKIPAEDVDRLMDQEVRKVKLRLAGLVERYDIADRERHVHVVKGDARNVIPDFAHRNGVDLIVMGTVGRTGIHGFFIGNTAEEILNQVDCSVLAVKPPGFETPVRAELATAVESTIPA